MDERYRLFSEALSKLEAAQKALSEAPDLRELNIAEKTAREALYNLQFTEGGLAYWVQDTARKRRYQIMTRPAEPVMPEPKLESVSLGGGIKEEQKGEYTATGTEKPKKKATRRKKNVSKEEE